MGRKRNKWNVSLIDGQTLAYSTILEILTNSKCNTLELPELIQLLNNRTKNTITYDLKDKNISHFIKFHFGGMKPFIISYDNLRISENKNRYYVHLIENKFNSIESEWEIIEDNYNKYD